MDLSTTYLGLSLRSPLVPSASPLSEHLDTLQRMEVAGAGAIVLHSLFEEQLQQDQDLFHHHLTHGTESFPEALTYFPRPQHFRVSPHEYLEHISKAKAVLSIPIIASLNGSSLGNWVNYAREIQQAGADALELNLYFVPANPSESGEHIENLMLQTLRAVKAAITIPVAVKLSPYFSSLAHMATRFDQSGADGLVLFNRFYQPDINLKKLDLEPNVVLSTPEAMRLPMRWIAILYGKIKADLAATSGIHRPQDIIKMIMVGSQITQLCSVLLKHGVEHIQQLEQGVKSWLTDHEYDSLDQLRGSMSQLRCPDPAGFERAQYLRALRSRQPYWMDVREPTHWT